MKSTIKGYAYVLGDDVDTDQIIPAGHLAIPLDDPTERARYGGLALSGVPKGQAGLPKGDVAFADSRSNTSPYSIIIAGKNFGCGSSREHAPIALAEAGVQVVVACSYARIFYRNAIGGGYFPLIESEEDLTSSISTGDEIVVDITASRLHHPGSGRAHTLRDLGAAHEILADGGLFAHARKHGKVRERKS